MLRNRIHNLTATFVLSCALCASAFAGEVTFIETFDRGSNEGNWTFGIPQIEVIQEQGGNPGWWLHSTCQGLACLDTFAPQLRTTPIGAENEFTGNFRERGVTSVGVDLITLYVDFSAGGRPLTLMLVNDNGNPGDFSDNWAAYYIGPDNIPLPGEGWKSYDFDVPSDATELPPGWSFFSFGGSAPPPDWNTLIEDVSQVLYFYGDPEMFFIFQQWELGLDNARITYAEECAPADLNCDGVVDVFDLIELINNWGPCDDPTPGNCPGDLNNDGVVDVFDLIELINDWG